jgi:hypothetical protein
LFGQNKSLTGYYAGGCIDSYCTIFRFDNDSVYSRSFTNNIDKPKFEKGKYKIFHDTLLVFFSLNESIKKSTANDSIFFYKSKYIVLGDTAFIEPFNNWKFCRGNYIVKINSPDTSYSILGCPNKQEFEYPLTNTKNPYILSEIEHVIQAVVDCDSIQKYYKKKQKILVIQNYQYINKDLNISICKFGSKAKFESRDEIKKENILDYIIIKDLSIEDNKHAFVNLKFSNNKEVFFITVVMKDDHWKAY